LLELAQKNPFDAAPFTWLLVKRVMVAVCSRVGTVQWDVGLVMALGGGGSDFHFGLNSLQR
jgi:hypothetical protein